MQQELDDEQLQLTRQHIARIVAGVSNGTPPPRGGAAAPPFCSPGIHGFSARDLALRGHAHSERWDGDEPKDPDGPEPETAVLCGPRPPAPPGGALARPAADGPWVASNALEDRCVAEISA